MHYVTHYNRPHCSTTTS